MGVGCRRGPPVRLRLRHRPARARPRGGAGLGQRLAEGHLVERGGGVGDRHRKRPVAVRLPAHRRHPRRGLYAERGQFGAPGHLVRRHHRVGVRRGRCPRLRLSAPRPTSHRHRPLRAPAPDHPRACPPVRRRRPPRPRGHLVQRRRHACVGPHLRPPPLLPSPHPHRHPPHHPHPQRHPHRRIHPPPHPIHSPSIPRPRHRGRCACQPPGRRGHLTA